MKIELEARRKAILGMSQESPERRYFFALFRLLQALEVPATKDYGLALFAVLSTSAITLDDGAVIAQAGHVGGAADIAVGVAAAFAATHPDPELWKRVYQHQMVEEAIRLIPEVDAKIRALPCVASLSLA